MNEWTEQEEQEMIERAKAGDAEANYELSMWALRRGEEEPDEPRWNRLAAKCLVKSAQLGYGPAQERMAGLLEQAAQQKSALQHTPEPEAKPQSEPEEEPEFEELSRRPRNRQAPEHRRASGRRLLREESEEKDSGEKDTPDDEDEDEDDRPSRTIRLPKVDLGGIFRDGGPFSQWGEAHWRKMELVCVAICVVLLLLIAVMVFTGRRGSEGGDTQSAIPPAGEVSPAATATPEPEPYPDEDTKAAIMAADLDIQPMEEDYRAIPTTATVTVNVGAGTLRLRKGPNTSYDQIKLSNGSTVEMPNGTTLQVYADRDDFSLVLYETDDESVYGWCSSDYLLFTAGTASVG